MTPEEYKDEAQNAGCAVAAIILAFIGIFAFALIAGAIATALASIGLRSRNSGYKAVSGVALGLGLAEFIIGVMILAV